MLGFLNLFTDMSGDSIKPQATTEQILNTKFVLSFILLIISKNMA